MGSKGLIYGNLITNLASSDGKHENQLMFSAEDSRKNIENILQIYKNKFSVMKSGNMADV